MKTFQKFLMIAMIAIVAVGCGKVEKILPKADGTWVAVRQETRYYVNNTLDTTEVLTTGLPTYTFQDDETGTWADGVDTGVFTWTVNDDNDAITLCQDFGGIQFCFTFDILESSKNAQKWTMTTTDTQDPTNYEEMDLDLERAE